MQEKSFSLPRKKVEPPLVLWMCSRSSTTPRISIIAARVNDSGGGKVQTQPETVMEAANNVHSFTHAERQAWRGSHLCNLGVGSSLACLASCIHMQKTKPQSPRSEKKNLFAWVQEAKQRKISEFTSGRTRLQPWQRSFKQSKWKSCMQRKCLLLSGHFVFIVSSEMRTRAGRERGKGNKKGRTLSRKRLISQPMKTQFAMLTITIICGPQWGQRADQPPTYQRPRSSRLSLATLSPDGCRRIEAIFTRQPFLFLYCVSRKALWYWTVIGPFLSPSTVLHWDSR